MARGSRGSFPGFSLIELLFSMAVMGTLTAMAVPQGLRAAPYKTRCIASGSRAPISM